MLGALALSGKVDECLLLFCWVDMLMVFVVTSFSGTAVTKPCLEERGSFVESIITPPTTDLYFALLSITFYLEMGAMGRVKARVLLFTASHVWFCLIRLSKVLLFVRSTRGLLLCVGTSAKPKTSIVHYRNTQRSAATVPQHHRPNRHPGQPRTHKKSMRQC